MEMVSLRSLPLDQSFSQFEYNVARLLYRQLDINTYATTKTILPLFNFLYHYFDNEYSSLLYYTRNVDRITNYFHTRISVSVPHSH